MLSINAGINQFLRDAPCTLLRRDIVYAWEHQLTARLNAERQFSCSAAPFVSHWGESAQAVHRSAAVDNDVVRLRHNWHTCRRKIPPESSFSWRQRTLLEQYRKSRGAFCWIKRSRKRIGIKRRKAQIMKNAYCEREGILLEGLQFTETSSDVCLGGLMNIENDMKDELHWRRGAAWTRFGPLKEATSNRTEPDLREDLDSIVLPAPDTKWKSGATLLTR